MKNILIVGLFFIVAGPAFAEEKFEPAQSSYEKADGLNGGLLYDKFWKKEEVDKVEKSHLQLCLVLKFLFEVL